MDRAKVDPAGTVKNNVYMGYRTPRGCTVYVEGIQLPQSPTARQRSPLGFEWGYGGSGPHALANAIISYEMSPLLGKEGAEQLADSVDHAFKEACIAKMPGEGGLDSEAQWVLSGEEVRAWLTDYVEKNPDKISAPWHDVELDDIWTE